MRAIPARQTFALLLSLSLVATCATACAGKRKKVDRRQRQLAMLRHEFTHPALGQTFRIVVYADDARAAEEAEAVAIRRMAELEEVLDDRGDERPGSEVARVHAAAGREPVRVSDELYALLRQADALAAGSRGAMDLTAGAYARLWARAVETGSMPTDEAFTEAKSHVGREKLRMDPINRTVFLADAGARLDLGGLAPAYVCDRVLAGLRRVGFPSAMVDGGGRIAVGDPPPGRDAWLVRVHDAPRKSKHRTLRLANRGIASSGRVGDTVRIDGQDYARLVHPATGRGVRTLAAVTVDARSTWQAEVLARAAAVLGEGQGTAFIRSVRGARGWFHHPANTRRSTAGPPPAAEEPPPEPQPEESIPDLADTPPDPA